MSTSPLAIPLPTEITQVLGQSANERVRKRHRALRSLDVRGDIKPGTILNLSPFILRTEVGLWSYVIPAAPPGKKFSAHTVTTPVTWTRFRGKREMSDKSLREEHDIEVGLPVQQLLEFHRAYSADGGLEGLKQGGIVVFEGDQSLIKKGAVVRVPHLIIEGRDRFMGFNERVLDELIEEAENQLRQKALNVIRQANQWYDQKGLQALNIQNAEHTWADFALAKRWINKRPAWRDTEIREVDQCESCGEQYVSKTGKCKCGFIRHPLIAFKSGEISSDHVRLDTLTAEEWKEVNAIIAERKKARG